jgi:hypothetical protein
MNLRLLILSLSVFLMPVILVSESLSQKIVISGTLKDANAKDVIHNAKITAIQNDEKIEQSATVKGKFKFDLNPGRADIIYQAPGYGKLKDTINIEGNKEIHKFLHKDSVNGWLTILLLVPGVFGLIVAWIKERADRNKLANDSTHGRMLVALVNGIVWAVVLAWIWHYASQVHGVTKIRFFHSSLAFEFFVPLLGYLGSLIFVFDLFRGKDSDSFKEKEFGMRIIMAPYVSIIMVALFGKEFEFINLDLESDTGQGVLAFVSGLIVVVAIQGIIERANEILGKWRRNNNPYVASPLAKKFELSEDEDQELSKIALRHPEQLLMWSDDDLRKKLAAVYFDEHLILAIKRKVEKEQLRSDISDLVWNRLKLDNVSTIQDFSTLSDEKLQQISKVKPELSDQRLKDLRGKIIKFIDNCNGTTLN